MTLEELKAEAERQGYKLVKKPEPMPKIKPCLCGRKTLDHRYKYGIMTGKYYMQIKCPKCEREGDWGESEREAREFWNMRVTD